jgi:hypothetical protein
MHGKDLYPQFMLQPFNRSVTDQSTYVVVVVVVLLLHLF